MILRKMQLNVFIERLFLNKSKHFKFFFKKIELFETLNDILYIKFIKHNFFNIVLNTII